MIKRSFFGLKKPKLMYESISANPPQPQRIDPSKTVTLFADGKAKEIDDIMIKVGEKVKTGQRLRVFKSKVEYILSSVTGTIISIDSYFGDFGREFTAVKIELDSNEELDNSFNELNKSKPLEAAVEFLGKVAGYPPVHQLKDAQVPIHTIVINAMPSDMLLTTGPYTLRCDNAALKAGIAFLKTVPGVESIVMAAPETVSRDVQVSGVEVLAFDSTYPSGNSNFVLNRVHGSPIPEGKDAADVGLCLIKAEAVAAIGSAFKTGSISMDKNVDVIKKDGTKVMVKTKIGTPVSDIFAALGITSQERDRIIVGGPMTGSAIYSEDYPILSDTDAIMIQDNADISMISDYACINCGECIRICPANVPVNMLVRFLEAGEYDEGADRYDLHSCIDCGLCSYVCTARIPVFQYIRLAKHELARLNAVEANNG